MPSLIRYAYLTTGLAIKALSGLSKARIRIHDEKLIPGRGSIIFVINHFTRLETILMPYYINKLTDVPVWSLADYSLFQGAIGSYLEKCGAVSTKNPDRDLLVVKSLLTGEANWIIFPEGRMVKSKKILTKGRFMVDYADRTHPPHTGAAVLALRTEFYRQRIAALLKEMPEESDRLIKLFGIEDTGQVINKSTFIVPVNITYYPIRVKENILSSMASGMIDDIPERMIEELMAEGNMLLSGVDIDIRFGKPLKIEDFIKHPKIQKDVLRKKKIDFNDPISSKKIMKKMAGKIMQQYMTAIYSMTTVNHDHLFASMFRMIPKKNVAIRDLLQRVFLSATCNLDELDVNYHTSLKADQVHLLTEDRYNKYQEFINIGVEKDLILPQGGQLVKNMSKISALADTIQEFHKIRIDNPFSVIANEVEPLGKLQKKLRRLSLTPQFIIRKRIINHLFNKAVKEFDADYEQYYIEGESKEKAVGRPFLIKGTSEKIGILLVHGYMAAPLEVAKLAAYLGRIGFWVYVPRLKGHGTSPEDLATRTYKDWTASVDAGYALIRTVCSNVIVCGFSTGAALALHLASRVKDIAGLVCVCPPRRLQDLSTGLSSAKDVWARLKKKVRLGGSRKDFIENDGENPHISYTRNPVSGIREIELLMDDLEPVLPEIEMPSLFTHSRNDPVADTGESLRIFELVGSDDKEYVLFNFKRHCIILGECSSRVHLSILNFIRYLEQEYDLK